MNFIKTHIKGFRKLLVISLTLILYLSLVYYFYVQNDLIYGLFLFGILYLLIYYFVIELKNVSVVNYFVIFFIGTFLEVSIVGYSNIYKIFSLIFLNISIYLFLSYIYDELNNRVKIYSFSVFTTGISTLSLFFCLSYAINFVGTYSSFDLNCDVINNFFVNTIEEGGKYLKIGNDEQQLFKNYFFSFSNTKVGDLLGIGSAESLTGFDEELLNEFKNIDLSGLNLSGFDLPNELLTGDQLKNQIKNIINNSGQQYISGYDNQNISNSTFLNSISGFREKFVNQVLKDKDIVDSGICNLMVGEIEKRYQDPNFKISVIVLILFLLWPISRLLFFVLSIFNIFIFKFFNLIRIYRFKKVDKQVEIID